MTRDEFEQLMSAALDAPGDAALRARLEAAAGGDANLAGLWRQWRRVDELLRAAPAVRVDEKAFGARVRAALDAEETALAGADRRLDEALAALPGSDERVDWERFGVRVRDSLPARRDARPVWPPRVLRIGVAGLAAAAALALAVFGPWFRDAAPTQASFVSVSVTRLEDDLEVASFSVTSINSDARSTDETVFVSVARLSETAPAAVPRDEPMLYMSISPAADRRAGIY